MQLLFRLSRSRRGDSSRRWCRRAQARDAFASACEHLSRERQIRRARSSRAGELNAHFQVRALHVELGNPVSFQEIDKLPQLFQFIVVHAQLFPRATRPSL